MSRGRIDRLSRVKGAERRWLGHLGRSWRLWTVLAAFDFLTDPKCRSGAVAPGIFPNKSDISVSRRLLEKPLRIPLFCNYSSTRFGRMGPVLHGFPLFLAVSVFSEMSKCRSEAVGDRIFPFKTDI